MTRTEPTPPAEEPLVPTASHPSGRTLRRLGPSVGALAVTADVLTFVEPEPVRERGVDLPAEASPP